MKRSLKYKLALLGCTSSCLMSAAYANQADSQTVQIEGLNTPITNAVCGADPRTYVYEVMNTSSRESIEIENFDILTLPGDDYPDNIDAVYVDQDELPASFIDYACEEETDYDPGNSCFIAVVIDPTELTCPEHPIVDDADIKRLLVVNVDAGAQTQAVTPIDLDITVLGTVQEYALFADVIIVDCDESNKKSECKDANFSQQPNDPVGGITQVSQDVGFIEFIEDPDDLLFHDGAELIAGLFFEPLLLANNYATPELQNQNFAASEDAQAAYDTLKAAAYDNGSSCVGPQKNLRGDDVTINPGIYCLVDINGDNDMFVVDGTLHFKGNHSSLFVFVMPSVFDDNMVDDEVRLEFVDEANYTLFSDDGHVDPDNIIWVGADIIEFDPATSVVGTFLSKGIFFGGGEDFMAFDARLEDSEPVGPAIIRGRLIGLESCAQECWFESIIFLNGNTILD